jgi:hypothetical protein
MLTLFEDDHENTHPLWDESPADGKHWTAEYPGTVNLTVDAQPSGTAGSI